MALLYLAPTHPKNDITAMTNPSIIITSGTILILVTNSSVNIPITGECVAATRCCERRNAAGWSVKKRYKNLTFTGLTMLMVMALLYLAPQQPKRAIEIIKHPATMMATNIEFNLYPNSVERRRKFLVPKTYSRKG
uniref:Uncharacterized protein n=1 Tax=Glossina pallidipes TaxID=7398 RepID=A0A1A9Z7J7_GLOPL